MRIISTTELRDNLKRYFELSKNERIVITQRGTTDVIELVRKERIEEDYISGTELKNRLHKRIDKLFENAESHIPQRR